MKNLSLCGKIVQSRRGLLAFLWSMVSLVTLLSFGLSSLYAIITAHNLHMNNYDDDNEEREEEENQVAITSRSLFFASLWVFILALCVSIYGTVVLGWQSPTGDYYSCCSVTVHRTTPMSIGLFIGVLIMFSNLTFVCSVLFGEFHIRDYQFDRKKEENNEQSDVYEQSAFIFSVLCFFLTVIYAVFSTLVYMFHESILAEIEAEARQEALTSTVDTQPGVKLHPTISSGGYVGGPFLDIKKTPTPGFQLS